MPVPIEENRARFLKLALEKIDRHRGEYKDREEQDEMLEILIDKHNLRHVLMRKGRWHSTREETELTVSGYRRELQNMAQKQGYQSNGKPVTVHDVFTKGSTVISGEYLAKVSHALQSASADSDDEEEEEDEINENDDPEEVDQDEIAVVPTKSSTNGQQPLSEATTERAEVANSTEESSHTEISIERDTQQTAGKLVPTPTPSPLSSYAESVVTDRKRKLSVENESGRQQVTAAKTAHHVDEVKPTSPDEASNPDIVAVQDAHSTDLSPRPELLEQRSTNKPSSGTRFDPTRGLVKLSNNAIGRDMNAIWTDIQSFTRKLVRGMRNSGDDGDMLQTPGPELELIYQRIFNDKWQKRASLLKFDNLLRARGITEAVLAAALFNMVWTNPVPWRGPKEVMEVLALDEEYIGRVLRQSVDALRVHTVIWQAASAKVSDREFQDETIRPEAENLANRFMLMFTKFAKTIGPQKPDSSFWGRRIGDISNIFCKALILKGQMEAAPDYYQCTWIKSGEKVADEKMEELHPGDGDQEVVWTVTPLVEKRLTQSGAWQVACPAKVLSRPRPQ